ncbi:hypothetical protein [Cupriavidus nantongensis]|nr:hypothetical protein [Cupriavidus nantongensis]
MNTPEDHGFSGVFVFGGACIGRPCLLVTRLAALFRLWNTVFA